MLINDFHRYSMYEFIVYFGMFLLMSIIMIYQKIYYKTNLEKLKHKGKRLKKRLIITTWLFSISLLYRAIFNFTKLFYEGMTFQFEN